MLEPRQNPAANELTPEQVAGRDFPNARRGLDPEAVRRFQQEVAAALALARNREAELRGALAAAQAKAATPEIDEATLTAALGHETAKVLRAAHDAARDVVARGEARAAELAAAAEALLAERSTEATEEAERLVGEAHARADALFAEARAQCREMIEEAREARRRILQDLAARRREMHLQIEQIRAAKDALVQIVERAAGSVGEIRDRLNGSEEAARRAAAGAEDLTALEDVPVEQLVAEALAVVEGAPEAPVPDPLAPAEAHQAPVPAPEPAGDVAAEVAVGLSPAGADAAPLAVAAGAPGSETELPTAPAADAPPLADAGEAVPDVGEGSAPDLHAPGESMPEQATTESSNMAEAVDELFARIRASRASDVAEARAVLGEQAPAGAAAPGDDATGGEVEGAPGGDEPAAPMGPGARRDELVAPAIADLERSLKRELRSDQNELLAAARGLGAHGDLLALVPGGESRARIAEAVQPPLAAVLAAGHVFVAEIVGGDAAPAGAPDVADDLADELADEVVGTIRAVLADLLTDAQGADEPVRVVGAAYRDWKGERVSRLAGDYATRAFARGVLDATSRREVAVRWRIDERVQACPECEDNALAEAQRPGDAFPTGQQSPPVHPGCRCLLLPAPS